MWTALPVRCPWCDERFEALVDPGEASTEYVEDCPVCCRPISMQLDVEGAEARLRGTRED
ncbi:CPXCG motif-containing cysteine-rich protein [Luteimonas deserti]|uniref:CPXCG motif-containing cysteine-rich protein n=1 Tax=Luteimonas deserti TaxID=2752306 RepID=A0A7Z0QTR6_9GAMM|nr:CPXCG motif-containing cysteine-rich protein [Luteimonas deserti]NYZ63303.1 CPXCG motif-containing cysteine-rich protein [Luteimonas deserti]